MYIPKNVIRPVCITINQKVKFIMFSRCTIFKPFPFQIGQQSVLLDLYRHYIVFHHKA